MNGYRDGYRDGGPSYGDRDGYGGPGYRDGYGDRDGYRGPGGPGPGGPGAHGYGGDYRDQDRNGYGRYGGPERDGGPAGLEWVAGMGNNICDYSYFQAPYNSAKKISAFFLDSYYFLNVLISTVHITAVCIYGLFLVFEYIIIIISTLRSWANDKICCEFSD